MKLAVLKNSHNRDIKRNGENTARALWSTGLRKSKQDPITIGLKTETNALWGKARGLHKGTPLNTISYANLYVWERDERIANSDIFVKGTVVTRGSLTVSPACPVPHVQRTSMNICTVHESAHHDQAPLPAWCKH